MQNNYLGTSLQFPLVVVDGQLLVVTGKDSVRQSLQRLLGTKVNDTFFLREYGNRLDEVLFTQSDELTKQLVIQIIRTAIDTWEGRCKFIDVAILHEEGTISGAVTYQILASNEIDSFIFPFYDKLSY